MELTKEEQELILKMRESKSDEKEFDITLTAYKNSVKKLIDIVDKLDEYSSKATENIKKRLREDEFFNIFDFVSMKLTLYGYREYFEEVKEDKGEDR